MAELQGVAEGAGVVFTWRRGVNEGRSDGKGGRDGGMEGRGYG